MSMDTSSESPSPEVGFEILEDIWMEILARVPMDLVVQLRCLSKFHRNMINNPGFIKKHSDQSHETKTSPPTYFITPSHNPPHYRGDKGVIRDYFVKKYDPDNDFDPTVVQRLNPPHGDKSYKCVGSCKGILLLRSPENIMLWNPLTGESRTFPKVKGTYKSANYFLGHDQTTDDLKIVKLMHRMKYSKYTEGNKTYTHEEDDPTWRGKCDCEIYSSKSGSWRSKLLEADHSLRIANHVGVFVEGTNSLHVIGTHKDERREVFVAAFDFSTEKFSRIPLPDQMQYLYLGSGIWSPDGRLCVYTHKPSHEYTMKVWMMKEYGNVESWTQVLRLKYGKLVYRNMMPLQYVNDGKLWILLSSQGVLYYDSEKNEVDTFENSKHSKYRFRPLGFEYTPSLRRI